VDNVTMNGSNMLFWHYMWLSGEVVNLHFSRFFNLSLEKNVSAKDMILGIKVEGGCWSCRRTLFIWET